jgi:membrane protein YdbS with pleckstrin-like domain
VIAIYVVGIAILWNIPYVHWSLWPFKVSSNPADVDVGWIWPDCWYRCL